MRDVVDDARGPERRTASALLKSAGIRRRIMIGEEMARLRDHHRGLQKVALDPRIKEPRLRALIRLSGGDFLGCDYRANVALRVVQIARDNRARRTDHHARRLEVE